jgi:hypothetical protein
VVWPNNEAKQAFMLPSAYSSPDIVCHKNSFPANEFLEVAAGGSIDLRWTPWPISHSGPIITYLAPAGEDFSKVDKVNLQFVKIEEMGLIRNSTVKSKLEGYYASNKLIDEGNKWTVNIPADVAAGNYIVRHEIIALMTAYKPDSTQHYPQCLNIKVTGNGKDPLASGVRAKDLYEATEPGIKVMIYGDVNYQIPGPPLYKFDGAVPAVKSPIQSASNPSSASVSAAPTALVTKSSVTTIPDTPLSSSPVKTPVTVSVGASATLISESSSVAVRPNNATLYPSFVRSPSKTPSAPSTPTLTPSESSKPNVYNYEFSGFNNGKSAMETAA